MNEMNVHSINSCGELRQGIELCLAFAPIVFCCPILSEFLHSRTSHALRFITNNLLIGPFRCLYPFAKVSKCFVGCMEMKRSHSRSALYIFNLTHLGGARDGHRCQSNGSNSTGKYVLLFFHFFIFTK